jgi:tetratricopeptide (TPR) repeat protein
LSDQPKNEGGAEDLLSKLFEMDESKNSRPAANNFSETTKIDSNISAAKGKPESSPNSTEVISKQSIEDLLQTPADKTTISDSDGDGDDIFEGILEEDPAAQEQINIFSENAPQAPAEQNSGGKPAPKPAQPAEKKSSSDQSRDKTILLQQENPPPDKTILLRKDDRSTAVEATTSLESKSSPAKSAGSSGGSGDPIDEALAEYAENENSRLEFKHQASASKIPEATPSRIRAMANESVESVSAGEFAEGFANEPIQIPDANSDIRQTWKGKVIRWGSIGATTIAIGGIISLCVFRIQSDRGLMGYRLDGFNLVKAYRPPNEAEAKEFEGLFKIAFDAREADDPKKIEESIASLKKVMTVDERNLQAASEVLEHASILSLWYGIKSPWGQHYADDLQKVMQLIEKFPEPPPLPAYDRAKARRTLALGEPTQAYSELVTSSAKLKSVDDETLGLLVELSYAVGNKSEMNTWISRLTRKPGIRVRHFQALMNEEFSLIQELASGDYLPAKVEDLIHQTIRKETAEKFLTRADTLLEEAKMFPPLALKLHDFRGDLYQFLGDTTKARDEWKPIVEQLPRESAIWIKIAKAAEEDALWDDALAAYSQAKKNRGLTEEGTLAYARLLRVRGKILDAVSVIDEALKVNAKSALLYYERGLVQMTIYQTDQAKSAFVKSLELDPTLEVALLGMANLAVQEKQWTEAERMLGKIPQKSPHHPEVLRSLAHISQTRNQFSEAEKYLRQAIDENPKLEAAYPELVHLYLLDEQDAKAEQLIKKGLDDLPRSPLLKVSMARIYQFGGHFDKALTELDFARKNFAHLPEVAYTVADVLIESKQVSQAYDVINPLIEKDDKDAELKYLKAKAFWKDPEQPRGVGSNEAAYRLMDSALQNHQQNIRYHILSAQIALLLQDKNSAIDHIEQVLKIKPHHSQALLIRGDLYRDTGDYEHATQTYLDALKYTRFQAGIYGRLADSFKAQGNSQKAIEYYGRVLKANPNDARAHLELGKLYSDDGRYLNSLKSLTAAVHLNPAVAETYYFLGFVHKELGNRMDAIHNFEKFLSLEPSGTEASTVRDEIYFLKGHTSGD